MEKFTEPQILVFGNEEIATNLEDTFDVTNVSWGPIKEISSDRVDSYYLQITHDVPLNAQEYRVWILDFQSKRKIIKICENDRAEKDIFSYRVQFPERSFDPAPLILKDALKKLLEDGLMIIFAGESNTYEYTPCLMNNKGWFDQVNYFRINTYSFLQCTATNKYGKKWSACDTIFQPLLEKHVVEYCTVFSLPTVYNPDTKERITSENYIPLAVNQEGNVISYLGYNGNQKVYEIVFPECRDKGTMIATLFSDILPSFKLFSKLFPESNRFSWLNDEKYMSDAVKALETEKKRIREKCEKAIGEVDSKIEAQKENEKYLLALLTETGDALVNAVKQYFEWLGFESVNNVDGTEEIFREDLRIDNGDDMFIIEIKGLGGTSTDAECAQVGKHRRRREKEYRNKNIYPLYIVNHQRYKNPELRENPPFSKDQIDYAESDERGLLTTLQLYRQYQYIEQGIFTKEQTRESLKKIGLITLVPLGFVKIGVVTEYFKKPNAAILTITMPIAVGDVLYAYKENTWTKGSIKSIQVDDTDVSEASNGEVGIVLDSIIGRGYALFKNQ